MATPTQTDSTYTGIVFTVIPTCSMCGMLKSGPICLHCDQPCTHRQRCFACRVGQGYVGIGPGPLSG